jgi:hypothetical protein
LSHTYLFFSWEGRMRAERFHAGVSLHSHTQHSWENLRFVTSYKPQWPLLPILLRFADWHHQWATGGRLDIARTFWRPPLSPAEALRLEAQQIHELGLPALVSLTDHDSIEAGLALRAITNPRTVPMSTEWTVPFGPTFFHIGVHNLPADRAGEIVARLHRYTECPSAVRLEEQFASLNDLEEVLLVLNHPLWDEAGIGADRHGEALCALLSRHRRWLHALELNGLRSWAENARVRALAAAWRVPLVSGGDRHGLEPNANINLTHAQTFAEFAAEVRRERISNVLFLPQYRDPLRLRWFETVRDLVRHYPGCPGGRDRWTDRFFYECDDGIVRPFASLWRHEAPALLKPLFAALRLSDDPRFRPALRLMLSEGVEIAG